MNPPFQRQSKPSHLPSPRRRPRAAAAGRKVRFEEGECGWNSQVAEPVPASTCLTRAERATLWWQKGDFDRFKSTARVIGSECRRGGYGAALDGTFPSNDVHNRCQNKNNVSCIISQTKQQRSLDAWCARGHSRRGLERWANANHGSTRQKSQREAIGAVLAAQERLKSTTALSARLDVKSQELILAQVSSLHSRTAVDFAVMLGRADAKAAAEAKHCASSSVRHLETQGLHQFQQALSMHVERSALDKDVERIGGDVMGAKHLMISLRNPCGGPASVDPGTKLIPRGKHACSQKPRAQSTEKEPTFLTDKGTERLKSSSEHNSQRFPSHSHMGRLTQTFPA